VHADGDTMRCRIGELGAVAGFQTVFAGRQAIFVFWYLRKTDDCQEPGTPTKRQGIVRVTTFIRSSIHALRIEPELTYMLWQQVRQAHKK
jgi:hypothetical protein